MKKMRALLEGLFSILAPGGNVEPRSEDDTSSVSKGPANNEAMENVTYREHVEREREREELSKKECYVCCLVLPIPVDAGEGFVINCPRCGIANVVTRSGNIKRPERLRIYRKYDGDLYNRQEKGLIKEMAESFEPAFREIKKQREDGLIDDGEYKRRYGALYREKTKKVFSLEEEKRKELDVFLREEKDIRERLLKEE